jgi:hypothetical protein
MTVFIALLSVAPPVKRISKRLEEGDEAYYNTLRKPTTKPTKIAE